MQQEKQSTYRVLFDYIVFSLSISLALAQGEDDRNYILIASMLFGPIILLKSFKKELAIDRKVIRFMLLLFFIPTFFNFHSIKWTSLMFTYMFLIYFLAGIHCAIKGGIDLKHVAHLVRQLIYAYGVVLWIQQCCVLFGLPVFNGSALMGDAPWKLNSLSAEPSHTSRMIGVLMYVYIYCQGVMEKKKLSFSESFRLAPKVWICFLWVTLTTVSGTAMLVVCVILSMFISKKVFPLFLFGIIAVVTFGTVSDLTALHRAAIFMQAVFSGQSSEMVAADHSASVRVVPWILCIQRINLLSLRSWIGEGPGSVGQWMSLYMPGVPDGWSGGGTACLIVEYGLIVGLYYVFFSFKSCYSGIYKLASIGLWILSVLMVGINMQMAWLCILMLFIVKKLKTNENQSILQLT